MNLLKIAPGWTTFWTVHGGTNPCAKTEHEYDDDQELESTDYGGSFQCIHCRAILSYDVSDMGD